MGDNTYKASVVEKALILEILAENENSRSNRVTEVKFYAPFARVNLKPR